MGLLDFLFPRDLEPIDRALSCRVRGGDTPVDGGVWTMGRAPEAMPLPSLQLKWKHPGEPYTPLRKLTASVVSEAKESFHSSLLNQFEISSSFDYWIIWFTLQFPLKSYTNSIQGYVCLDKWLVSSDILAVQHFCLHKYQSLKGVKQTLDRIRTFKTTSQWLLKLP